MRPSRCGHDDNELLQTLHDEQLQVSWRFRPIGLVFNGGFALLFIWLQIWPLAISYGAGLFFFEWRFWRARRENYRAGRMVLWVWLIIFAQALLAVLMLGPGAGFQFYLISTLIQAFSSLTRPLPYKIFQGLVIIAFFILCDIWFLSGMAPYALTPEAMAALRHFNILGFCAVLAWTAHSHALAVRDAESALRHIASSDPLTGLLNRRAINEIAEREVQRSRRQHHALSLILCDIDHFKRVNDTWGHAAGDHVLETVASQLQGALREYDHPARWGGEEFLLLLPETDLGMASQVAERLRQQIEACVIHFEGERIPVTLTLGVAEVLADENWHATVNRADAALYQGKEAGRNRVIPNHNTD